MVVFLQRLVASSQYAKKCPYAMTPTSITVHNTANDASAANEIQYMSTNDRYVSFHTAIDDVEIIQAIPYTRNAFHAGDGRDGKGNRTSIAIEICYSKSGGKRYELAEQNAVHYIAQLLHTYGWGIDRVKQHYDWSQKNCPHRIRAEGRWASFLQRIEQALAAYSFQHKIGYDVCNDANAYRVQSGKYATKEAAEEAARRALQQGIIHYATIVGVKE